MCSGQKLEQNCLVDLNFFLNATSQILHVGCQFIPRNAFVFKNACCRLHLQQQKMAVSCDSKTQVIRLLLLISKKVA